MSPLQSKFAGIVSYCRKSTGLLQFVPMEKQIDTKKALSQHLEMDSFFAGDFTVKGPDPRKEAAEQSAELLGKFARKVARCKECGLASSRTNTVPGEGSPAAKIVFVGEAPGEDEDKQGRPFVGRAGKLLDKIIAAMGLSREDVFICNILKCRPPGNRDPEPNEITKCLPLLLEQLEIIDPEIIVTLGAHAARTLLESKETIGRLRGSIHEYYPEGAAKPIKLVATYHPAYLLRSYSPENRRKVWDDMKVVMEQIGLAVPPAVGKQ
jgi:uracil-DNA glycosylase